MNEFKKFAVGHLGMNSLALDSYMQVQSSYISPTIIEERPMNVAQMDVFSRLMMDRIIFLGTQINDYTANVIQAQLLFLDSSEPGIALPHSRVMIHQPLGGMQGQASDLEIAAREILKVKEELYTILSEHSGQPFETIQRDSDRDYWMTATEAQAYGMVDRVLTRTEK